MLLISQHRLIIEKPADCGNSFVWTGLQMEQLLQLTCRADVKEYLDRAPAELEDMYKLLLWRIKEQHPSRVDLASRILTWLTVPNRLLTLSELRQALSVAHYLGSSASSFDPDRIPPVWAMEEVCMGLVTIDEGKNVIKLSHHSLGNFLSTSSRHGDLPEIQNTDYVAQSCIACIKDPELAQGPCNTVEDYEKRISKMPFALYVAENWGYHIGASPKREDRAKEVLGVLESGQCLGALVQLMYTGRGRDDKQDINQFPKDFSVFHMVSHFGLDFTLKGPLLSSRLAQEVNNTDSWGRTPLHIAAQRDDGSVCRVLLSKDARTDARDANDESPLHYAVSSGNPDTTRLFLNCEKHNISKEEGQRLLGVAAKRGHLEIFYTLVKLGHMDVTEEAVHLAASEGHFDLVDALFPLTGYKGVSVAMLEAARQGAAQATLRLFEQGADIDATDNEEKMTALHYAVDHDQTLLMARLLSMGADVEARDSKGRTPLFIGAENGHLRAVQELLELGAVMHAADFRGRTPLEVASAGGYTDIVRMLCSRGPLPHITLPAAESDKAVESGEPELTALQAAALHGHVKIVTILLANGADPNQRGRTNRTPLSYAAEAGHSRVVRRLLDAPGVDASALDSTDNTPLSYAVDNRRSHPEIINMLLEASGGETLRFSPAETRAYLDMETMLGASKGDASEPGTEFQRGDSYSSL